MTLVNYTGAILLSYLIGSINPAYFLGRIKGFDIREKGTGNAGATNTYLNLGLAKGIFVMVFDILKVVFALWLVNHHFKKMTGMAILSGMSVLLGHCHPFYLRFRGGKGIASYFGLILFFLPPLWALFSFVFYWASSAFIAFKLKKKAYVPVVGPLIGMLYFIAFAPEVEVKLLGVTAGIYLGVMNYMKAVKIPGGLIPEDTENAE